MQTVFQGSTHESGEAIKWEWDVEAPTIPADILHSHVARFAAACLLARYWPEGARNDATLALTGGLLHSGWKVEKVSQFVEAVITASGDGELEYTVISSKADLEKENLLPKLAEKIELRLDLGHEHSISDFVGLFSGKDNAFGLSRDKLKHLINLGIDKIIIGLREPINPKRNVHDVLYVIEQKLDLIELESLITCEPN